MQNLSSGTFTCYVNTERKLASLILQLTETGDCEQALVSQALQQADLHLRFLSSGLELIYRTSRIVSAPSSSPTQDTSSETSTSNNPTRGRSGRYIGISFAMLVILICASLVTFILALAELLFLNSNGIR
jgi:hypothetical protein